MSHLFTIGHSNTPSEHFLGLLKRHNITAVADVRSVPASRYMPQFNREVIKRTLHNAGIWYVFLGKELGARSSDLNCYIDGVVQYDRLAETDLFKSGIDRLINGVSRERIAIMCTEADPLNCHRTVLVSRVLTDTGMDVTHIHGSGETETHNGAMLRLRQMHGLEHPSLLETEDEMLAKALKLQEHEIAYVDEKVKTEQ